MGGWSGEGKDTIVWDGAIKAKELIADAIIGVSLEINGVNPITNHPHQDVQTTASPDFVNLGLNGGNASLSAPSAGTLQLNAYEIVVADYLMSVNLNSADITTLGDIFTKDLTATGTGHFGGDLDTDANLTVDGYMAIGTTPNSLYGLYVRSSGSARTRGVYGYVFYSGTGAESYGGYFRGFNNVVPAGTYSDNYGGRFESSIYKNTIATGKTLRSYGGYFRAQDYSGRTYAGDGDYELIGGYMLIQNATGDWTTNNPSVTTYGLKIGGIPTGYGSNHTHYSLHIADGTVYIGSMPSGATQVAAGVGANELWKTSGHTSLPDNVVMIGA